MSDTWEPEVAELRRREELARQMGGPDKVRRQHDAGRLTVRERIDALLDQGTFHEVGALAGRATYGPDGEVTSFVPANFLLGRGTIDGRPVVVGGDDFTVRGGAADAAIVGKQVMAERMANELRLPLVRLVDGTGGGGSVKSLDQDRRTYVPWNPGWEWVVSNLATVPVVALALGPVAGLGAARVVSSHYSMMVRGTSQLFVAGPPLVARLGEHVDKEALGGSAIHTGNGVVDDEVASEQEAFERTRRFLSYLPPSVDGLPPRTEPDDDPDRREDWLVGAVPRDRRKVYAPRPIVEAVVDRGSWFELGRGWGRSAVTGLARLDGWPVAVLAGDPYHYGGGWTAAAADKVTRFVDLADTFHLPVVHLVDQPGFLIRHRGRAGRHHPGGGEDAGRHPPGRGAVVLGHPPQGVRRGRRRPPERRPPLVPLRLAVGRLGVAAAGGRRGGRLPGRARRRAGRGRPRRAPRRAHGHAGAGAVAVPHGRGLPGRGADRPEGHEATAVRVRQPGRTAAPAGTDGQGAAAVAAGDR